jgi:cytochrome b561
MHLTAFDATPPRVAAARPAGEYNTVAKWFHWVTVPLMALALLFGLVIKHIRDADKMWFYMVHESAGLTILAVAVARLAWRWRHPPPPQPGDMPAPMRLAAGTVHTLLYAALIAQPILGFVMTNAFGFPLRGETAYLGLIDLPKFMEANLPLAEALKSVHRVVGWSIGALLVAHIGGVVFHQAIRRDGTLMRMV